jgi:hypothetical protein
MGEKYRNGGAILYILVNMAFQRKELLRLQVEAILMARISNLSMKMYLF